MNPFIWCGVGALIGWLAGHAMGSQGATNRIENIVVGIFGAFVGGDFFASVFSGGATTDSAFRVSSLGLAAAGAVVMLVLLRLMRGIVGPLRSGKPRRKA